MSDTTTITILGKEILVVHTRMNIHDLLFYEYNPRIYSKLQENNILADGVDKQQRIQEMMLKESSVKNLIPAIKHQEGITDPIWVKYETHEVLEGNSRLVALRKLSADNPNEEKWKTAPCMLVSGLDQDRIDAYLHQIHVKGKTHWQVYEKAHMAYKRVVIDETPIEEYSQTVGETKPTIEKQIKIIELMKKNGDTTREHLSYYEVLLTTKPIKSAFQENNDFKNFILGKIKNQREGQESFTSGEMRNKLPDILSKRKTLKKFMNNEKTLDDAYQMAKPSSALKDIKNARDHIGKIEQSNLEKLDLSDLGAVKQGIKKCNKAIERLSNMVKTIEENKNKEKMSGGL